MDRTKCAWTESDDGWVTDCGRIFAINDGTPAENEMRFCFSCGRPLVEEGTEELVWEGDDAAEPEEA